MTTIEIRLAPALTAVALFLAPLFVIEARAQTVEFGAATYTATEGGTGVVVVVELDSEPPAEVTIPLSRTNANGTENSDYTGVPPSVTFGTTETSKSFTVNAASDTRDEPNKSVTLGFGTLSTGVTPGTRSTTTVNLEDDDPTPTLDVSDADATEGSVLDFTVTLSAASDYTVTVSYATSFETGNTAAVSGDLSGTTSGTLTFSPGDTSMTASIGTNEDSTDEENETFTVTLSSPSNATITDATGTGTINNDDNPPTVSVANAAALEGNDIDFRVTLSVASGKTVTVNYATSFGTGNTAAVSGDLSGTTSGTLTFSPGDTSMTASIGTNEDSTDEENETFTVTLSGASNATITDANGTGTINDDDNPPTVSVANAAALEGNDIDFSVTLSVASAKTVTVSYATSFGTGNTAAVSGDLSGTTSGTLTFSPGDTSMTASIGTNEDSTDEENETFTVTLSGASNATITDANGTGTINDDDNPPTVSVANAAALEGNDIDFSVTLSVASAKTVTVNYATSFGTGNTAAVSGDLSGTTSGTLTFSPGDTSMTASIGTNEDSTDEENETFTVTLSGASNATITDANGTGTINDDDNPPTVSVANAAALEGNDIDFSVTLSVASAKTVTVNYATSFGTGNTAAVSGDLSGTTSGTLTFSPGDTSMTASIGTNEDSTDEENETFTVTLSGASNATITDANGTGTINDDDNPPTVSVANAAALEGNDIDFSVTLSVASAKTVTVNYATSFGTGNTAAVSGDLSGTTSGTLTFSPGDTSMTASIGTNEDSTDEENETFTVTLSGASNATIANATGTGTITNDDNPPTVSVANANAMEGDDIDFRVTLSAASGKTVTVNYATSEATTAEADDFTAVSVTTLTFSPGETLMTFMVSTTQDSIDEDDETFGVTLTLPANANVTLNQSVGVGTINDDDDPPTVSVNDANAMEGDDIDFRVTLSAASGKTVTVNYATSEATTAEADDFTAVSVTTLTFSPGETLMTFMVSTTQDSIDEDDETFGVTLTLPTDANVTLNQSVGTGTINDDDDPPTVSVADANAEEGNGIAFTAELSEASERLVTVTYTASAATGNTAKTSDLSGTLTGTLTFAARTASTTDTIQMFTINTLDDNIDERNETFTVTLSNATNVTIVDDGTAEGTGTITDNDDTPTVTLMLSSTSTGEKDATAVTVTAELNHPSTEPTTVNVLFTANSPAKAEDFTPSMNLNLDIAAEATMSTGTVNLTPVDNETDAPNKVVTVSAMASNGLAINDPTDLTLEIVDDDPFPVVTLALTPFAIKESPAAGTHVTTVTAELDRPSSAATTVMVSADAVSPAEAEDFSLTTDRVLTIAAGSKASTETVTITAVDNQTDAPNKEVTVSATADNSHGFAGNPSNKTLTIEDDEPAPTVTLELAQDSIRESDDSDTPGDQHITTVTVKQQHPSSQTTTITLTPSPGDFSLSDSGTLTILAGATGVSAPVTLTAVDNNIHAPNKVLTLNATASNDQGVEQPTGVPLTIEDDELPPTVKLILSDDLIGELGGEATVTATLSHPSSEQTTVTVSATPVSPAVGEDFALAGTVLAISALQMETTDLATLTSVDNGTHAPDKQVTVSAIAMNSHGIAGDPESLSLTIEDDELAPTVTLSLSRNPIPEAGGVATVTAQQSHPSSEETTVTVSATAVSPAVAEDFALLGTTLRVAAGRVLSTGTVTLTAEGNSVDALNKAVTVSGAAVNTQGVAANPPPLTLTITDDDERGFVWNPTELTMRVADPAHFALALASEPTADVTVTMTATETERMELAEFDQLTFRYHFESEITLTFTPSNWSEPQRLTTYMHSVGESVDATTIRAVAAGGDYAGHRDEYPVRVVDNEKETTGVLLTVDRTEIAEGAGTTNVKVTAILNGAVLDEATSVAVSVGAGTASEADFTASPATFTLTIPANEGSAERTIALTPIDDGLDEIDEETVSVSGTVSGLDVTAASITILDDDARGVTVSRQSLTVDENGSRSYTVVLDSQPSADVTVTASVAGDSDVTVSPTVLTFTTTNWARATTVTVSAADDNDSVDDSATVSHAVAGADYGTNSVTASSVAVTVADDDARGVQVSTRDLSISEDGSMTYTVVLNTQPTGNVTVTPSVTGDTDVTISPPVLTFSTATWSQPQTVTVSAARDFGPDDDRAAILHTVAGSDYEANGVTAPEILVSVIDDGLTVVRATLSVQPDTVAESLVLHNIVVILQLDGAAPTSDTAVSILVRGGTASVTDFKADPAAITLTIPAGETETSGFFFLDLTNDNIDESDGETITISGSHPNLDIAPVELTITDDDKRGLRVSRSTMTVNEGASDTYRLVLTSAPTDPVTVTPTLTGASEVTVRPETLNFNAGNWDFEQQLTVSVAPDPDADDGEATLTHVASGGDYDGLTGAEIAVIALDNGIESAGIRLSVSPDTVDENGGPQTVTVTAMLDAAARATDTEVTVTVESGTAEKETDFSDVADFTLTIPANGTQVQGNFQLEPQDDFVDEGDGETLFVNGTAPDLLVRGAGITITDDDATSSTITLTASPQEVPEGATGAAQEVTLTAELDAAARTGDTEVRISVSGLTARSRDDFEVVSDFTLTIPANETIGEETFALAPVDDRMDEPVETLRVTGRASGLGVEPSAGLELTITDNDDTPVATLSLTPATIREDGGVSTVTATLDHPSSELTTLTISAVPVPPAQTGDFSQSGTTLTIPAGGARSTGTVTLAAVDNDVQAGDQRVTVSGSAENTLGVTSPSDQTLTIADDESPSSGVVLTVSPATVAEGATGDARTVTVTATLDGAPSNDDTEVTVSVGSGTAVSGDDFPAVNDFTITIVSGSFSGVGSFDLAPVDDETDETDETVAVTGTASGLTVSSAMVTITDPVPPPPSLTLALSPERVAEGATGAARTVTVTATLDGALRTTDTEVTVSVAGDTATEGDDFAAVADFALTIPAGATGGEGRFTLAPVDDAVDETDETVVVTGASTGVAVSPSAGLAVTIADDDERGVTVTPTVLAAPRGGSARYHVALNSQPTAAVTVGVTSDNAAVTPEPAFLTFEPDAWNVAQRVTVQVTGDETVPDGAQAELTHTVTGGDYEANGVVADAVTVTVTVTVRVASAGLTVAPSLVSEGATGAARTVAVTATLEGEPRTVDVEVTVSVAGGTATEGDDFAAVEDFALTIAAGTTSGTGSFTLAPVDDAVDEPDETVVVTGASTGLAVSPSAGLEVTIADDDERGVTVTPTALAAPRGGSTNYELVLASQPTEAVTIEVTSDTPGVTVDPALLTFEPDAWNVAQAVTVLAADDETVEDGATVTLTHTVAGGDYGDDAVTVDPVVVTVTVTSVVLTVSPERVAEGATGAARTVAVTATLEGEPRTVDVEVTVSVAGGTATEGDDFAAVEDFALTIAAGTTTGTGSFTLAPVDDAVDEPDETVVVTGTAAGVAVSPSAGLEVTIADDDERGVTVTPTVLAAPRGGSANYELVLASQPTEAVTIEVTSDTPGVTVDPALLTFEPDAWNVAQAVTVLAADDETVEDGATVTLTHTVAGGDYGDDAVTVDPVVVTVTVTSVVLTVSPERVAEGATGAARTVAVTATLEGEPRTVDVEVTVSVTGGTAMEGDDFAAVEDFALTIAAGTTSGTGSLTLAPVDDAVDEPDETVVVTGTAAGVAVSPSAGLEVTIADDDERGVTVTPTVLAAPRGGSANYELVLASQPTEAVTIEVTSDTPGVTVDPALLTFEPDAWNVAQVVTVLAADDETVEDGATVTLTHTVTGGDYGDDAVTVDPVVVTVTVTVTAASVVLTVSPERVAEGATGAARTVAVTATLEGEPRTVDVEVTVSVTGGTATEGDDFAAVEDFALTIAAGTTSGTGSLTLAPVDDAVDEPDETVVVTGTAAGVAVSPSAGLEVTIADDDERGVTVTPTVLAASRGGSTSYELVLASQPIEAVTIEVTSDTPGVTVDPALLTFEPDAWNVAQAVTVLAADDETVEDGATVTLTHTVAGGDYGDDAVTVDPVVVTVTVTAAAASVVLTVSPERVAEGATGDGRTVAVTATLEGEPRTVDVEVTVSVTGGTAMEGDDFAAVEDFALTIAAGTTSGTGSFTLAPVDDAVDEPDETVVVTGASTGLAVSPSTGLEVTIADDDERGVTVTPTALAAPRGGSANYELVLASQPIEAVTIEVTSDTPGVTVDPALLTFEPDAWNVAQVVTVLAADDETVEDGATVTLTHTVAGGDYEANGVVANAVTVTVRVASAGLTVAPSRVSEGATGDARSVTVTARLDGEPRADDVEVTVSVAGGTAMEGDDFVAVADFTLTIPAGATDGEGRFTLAPVDDAVAEPDETVVVTGRASGLATATAAVTIADDDERGVTVAPTALTVLEGRSGSYEVALTSQPTAAVTVAVTSNHADVAVAPESLMFTPSSWNTVQTVTVSAADDQDVEEDAAARLTHVVSGGDYEANSVTADPVEVTVPGLEVEGMVVTFRIPAIGDVEVPDGTPLPGGMRLTVPATLAGNTVTIRAAEDDPALVNPPRGFNAGDAVVDIELARGMALDGGQTATLCLPVEGRGRVYRYDSSASPPEWVELPEPAGGSPEGLACGVTDRFSLFAVGTAPNERVATSWLGRFGRTVAQHVVDAVRNRMSAPRTEGFEGTLAGYGIAAGRGELAVDSIAPFGARDLLLRTNEALSDTGDEFRREPRSPTSRDMLTGSAFALTEVTDDGRSVALWGRGAYSSFGGQADDAKIDGDVTTATLGADWAKGRYVAGLAVSRSAGTGTWRQNGREDEIESSLMGLHPYIGYEASERLSVWAVAGHGWGELTMPDGARTIRTDIDMTMAAAGARSELTPFDDASRTTLALEVDGLFLRIGSEAVKGLEGLRADVTRLRLGVEGSRTMEMANGAGLTPRLQAALRMDGGDVENGVGLEIGGGLAFTAPVLGVSSELSAHTILVHQEAEFEDWGITGSFTLDRDRSSERGVAVSLRHSVGSSSSGGADRLFSRDSLTDFIADEGTDAGARFDSEIGYGFLLPGGQFTGTPYFGLGLTGSGRDYTLGWRLAPVHREGLDLTLTVEGTRHEPHGSGDSRKGVSLRLRMRW